MIRRLFTAWLLIATLSSTASAEQPRYDAAALMTPKTRTAAEQGLVWLATRQHDDGSFGSGDMRGNTAVTALVGMAFLSGGSTPDRGPHGANVARTVDYLLSQTETSGLIINRRAASQGPMYGQGFATLFLAECHGMSRRRDLREILTRAVKLIVDSQNREGGWRYWPDSPDADVSVTVCQAMALRAARNAGIDVPKKTIDRCMEYIIKCQNPDGGFAYMTTGRRESLFPRSAAAVTAFYGAGRHDSPEIAKGLNYLLRFPPDKSSDPAAMQYYYYGQYYAAQAMWQAGGRRWKEWYPAVRDDLLARREKSKPYWTSPNTDDYATAMACIVLQMPYDYLPIFQR